MGASIFGPDDSSVRSDLGDETGGELSSRARRRWQAPQFMLTDIALTDMQNNFVSDNATGSGPSPS